MAKATLDWNGPAVTAKLEAAQVQGVNATMGRCVNHAKRNHPWRNRTGHLEGSIQLVDLAKRDGNGVRGVWGSTDQAQALILELGGIITPKKAQALKIPMPDGSFRFVKWVRIPAYPYLRPAADAIYPQLAANIRVAYERGGTAPAGGGGNG